MRVLGISAFYHDAAAVLVEDGRIVAAGQEERFTRKRFDAQFPERSIQYCLKEAGCRLADVDYIVFYDKPFEKFDRILETFLAYAPRGFSTFRSAMPRWLKEKLFLKKMLTDRLREIEPAEHTEKIRFSDHHLSHAASAFFPSGFDRAAVLVLDGVGEWATVSAYLGEGTKLTPIKEHVFPHSLGLLYSAFTAYCGFRVNSGEYKLMGLAPYGKPIYADVIKKEIVRIADDGSFALNLDYFDFSSESRMTNSRFDQLFGGPPRISESPMLDRHKDLAASMQAVLEEILLKMTRSLAVELGVKNLCLAGGVALNCVANGKILRDGAFEKIWIQPAAGDAGGALGAALIGYHVHGGKERFPMEHAFLGQSFSAHDIEAELHNSGARYTRLDERELYARTVDVIAEGGAVGWFQGRSEFGPRALGNRSILADARGPSTQSTLNEKIKFRESFRPFAPAVTIEDCEKWFDLSVASPYMLLVAQVNELGLHAIRHIDGSARVQTVDRKTNPRFHALLEQLKAHTGCPVVVNTSFNVRGEPIVNTPAEAWRCFMGSGLDALAIGDYFLLKSEQDPSLLREYHQNLEKD